MLLNKEPCSNLPPIANVYSLASILSTTEPELIKVAGQVDSLWKKGKILYKKDGTPRPTSDAKEPLKTLHEHIKNRLLKKVTYPLYLLGGIADPINPRNYKEHAAIHSNKKILISEDVANFFPSTSTIVVKDIWQHFFRCTPEIATLLTTLTTHGGCLPQGWKTSGYLANLVFWDKEPQLVNDLENLGFSYSRFMDDITVSASRSIDNKEKSLVISKIYGIFSSKQYSPKRKKHEICPSHKPMVVTGLNVNSKKPTLGNL